MQIKRIEIRNFRALRDHKFDCEDFNTFVGPNGAGKSTVLHALNAFFGEYTSFSDEDFHCRNVDEAIVIQVTFGDLSDAAREDFKHYLRGGQLVVQAKIIRQQDGKFKRSLRGERLVFEPFVEFFDAKSAKSRSDVFSKLRSEYPEIGAASNDSAREQALQAFEEKLPEEQKKLVISGDDFFGVSKGMDRFRRHVHWVYVPAVKDASSEAEEGKASHLGKLIEHTIRSQMNYQEELDRIKAEAHRQYAQLLTAQRKHLKGLQGRLSQRLQASVTSDADLALDWKQDDKAVAVQSPIAQVLLSDHGFEGEVASFGHGLQRSFLLVILQELMGADSETSPTLLLGCEEPELYQHPPQARHLASILMELSKGDAQIFVTTHSPYFVDADHFGGIKMFRSVQDEVHIRKSSLEDISEAYNVAFKKPIRNQEQTLAKLAIQAQPKFNEIFFAEKVVLVEGISDRACLETYLRVSGRHQEFQRSGATILVCEGKSSLAFMLLIATRFSIPFHVVFDCDDSETNPEKRRMHVADNDAIFELTGYGALNDMPQQHIFEAYLTAWTDCIEPVLDEQFDEHLEGSREAGSKAVGQLRNAAKNPVYVAAAMQHAFNQGQNFPIFRRVVDNILLDKL